MSINRGQIYWTLNFPNILKFSVTLRIWIGKISLPCAIGNLKSSLNCVSTGVDWIDEYLKNHSNLQLYCSNLWMKTFYKKYFGLNSPLHKQLLIFENSSLPPLTTWHHLWFPLHGFDIKFSIQWIIFTTFHYLILISSGSVCKIIYIYIYIQYLNN